MLSSHTPVVFRELAEAESKTGQDYWLWDKTRYCEELDWQFERLGNTRKLPKCGGTVKPIFTVYRGNDSCKTMATNSESTEICEEKLIDKSVSQILVAVHGFRDSNNEWLFSLKDALVTDPDRVVVVTDWGKGAGKTALYYSQAAANTRYVGVCIAKLLYSFRLRFVLLGLKPKLHCVGHSLGAHVCGFAGAAYKKISEDLMLDRITGLDPAGPLFSTDSHWPFNNREIEDDARLSKDDAKFVDVIHTNCWGGRNLSPHYGTMNCLGHQDFFPGAEGVFGNDMPGCSGKSCSHSFAYKLFISSITSPCMVLQACNNTDNRQVNACTDISSSSIPMMGFWSERFSLSNDSIFTVDVSASEPFCENMGKAPFTLEEQSKAEFPLQQFIKRANSLNL